MTKANVLIKKITNGFSGLEVSQKYIDSALNWLETWLTDEAFKDYVPQIASLIAFTK